MKWEDFKVHRHLRRVEREGYRMSKYYKADDVINCIADILAEEANMRGFKPQSPNYFKDKACGVLQDLPTLEVSEDCISKAYLEQEIENQAMTVEKDKEYWRGWNNALDKVVELIEDAPSVVPSCQKNRQVERAEGEWIKRTKHTLIAQVNFAYCSECGQPIMHEHTRPLWNYCPNCGAKMKSEE